MAGVSVDLVARALDVSERQVQRLVREKVLPRPTKGLYDLGACLVAALKHERAKRDAPALQLAAEKLKLLEAKRVATEQAVRTRAGELWEAAHVMRDLEGVLIPAIKLEVMSVPQRVTDIDETLERRIRDECVDALDRVAQHLDEYVSKLGKGKRR